MRASWSPKDCSLWKHKAGKAALLQDQPEVPNGFSVAASGPRGCWGLDLGSDRDQAVPKSETDTC